MSGPPGNGEAALGDAATPKLTGARDYSACPHSTTLIQQHAGRLLSPCGRALR